MENGNILVCEYDGISEIDTDGSLVRQLKGVFGQVADAKPLDTNSILVSDCGEGAVFEIEWSGNVLWSISDLHCPSESIRLPNGNTLVADGTSVLREFSHDKEVIWSATLSYWASSMKRLSNGQTIVAEGDGAELLDESGITIWSRKGYRSLNSVDILPNGDFLFSEADEGRIFVMTQNGEETWTMDNLDIPWEANLLP